MKSAPNLRLPVSGISIALLACLASLLAFPAGAQEAASPSSRGSDQLRRAQQRLVEGDFEAALGLFESVETAAFSDADRYNHGIALYRSQRLEAAAEAFRSAASASDPSLAARARYNLGNTSYARALELIQSESAETLPAAISSLEQAIDHYRSALRVAPQDRDARVNIELASNLIEKLKQQQQEQQQQQQQQDQGQPQDQQDQQQEQSDEESNQDQSGSENPQEGEGSQPQRQEETEQESDSQPSEAQQDQQQEGEEGREPKDDDDSEPENQNDGNSKQQPSDQAESERPSQGEKPGEEPESKDQEDSPGQSPSDGESEALNRPSPQQQQQRPGESEEPEPSEPDTPDETPEGELTAASESADPSEQESTARPSLSEPIGDATRLTPEEARKLLQLIRDRDMQRRRQQERARSERRIPVERDW